MAIFVAVDFKSLHFQQFIGRLFMACTFILAFNFSGFSQTPDTTRTDSLDFYDMTLDQLLTLKAHGVPTEMEALINQLISVASKKPLSTRESPSIVTLVTEEEIKNSGARDLIDVLRLVPGMDFGMDVEGVVGIGMRGNWAHEGKVLLLLDGQEMNEIMFATTQFGNHFPVDQIKKIEIIRGPGSAIYGGFAEYGVVNIITRQGEDLQGVSVSGTYGQMAETFARRNINLSLGQKINDFEYSLSGMFGEGNRSDQDFSDFYGGTYNMAGNSALNPKYGNLGIKYKGLSFRTIADYFTTTVRDGYDLIKSGAYTETFNSIYSELKYVIKVNEKFTITPRINFKQQAPWKTEAVDSTAAEYHKIAQRLTGNLTASYQFTRNINFVAGAEVYQDKAQDKADSSYFSNGEQEVKYFNYAFFTQGLVKTWLVNLVLGARYDKHNIYGDAFVPRVGLTKKYNKFHFKALYSNAFRAPSIENINLMTDAGIKPEKTQVIELEMGYQLTRKSFFTVNFYDITTNDPIVYFYDDSTFMDTYINGDASGTRGIEAEYRIKQTWGYVNLNYAFYTAAGKDKIEDYEVSEDDKALLGFSNHRLNLNASVKIGKGLFITPTISFYSARWGYTSVDTVDNSILEKFDPTALVNLFIRYQPIKGLTIGAGVYDMFNQRFAFIQPYNGYHAPLPGPSREFVFKLQYDLQFKKEKRE